MQQTRDTNRRQNLVALVEVIINASSGFSDNDRLRDQIANLFGACGISVYISLAKNTNELIEFARSAAASDAAIIVGGGGDGTINAVASALMGTDKTLGVLPLGTLNHFAKDLKIPLDVEKAIATIIEGHAVQVDVGEVNGRIFLNNSSLGLYPSIVHEREQKQKLGQGKWPAFVWATFGVMRRYPFLDVRLNADGKEFSSRTPFVFIGNNEYAMESFDIGGRSRLDAGRLSLYFSHRTGRLGLLRLGVRALLRRLHQSEDFVRLTTTEVLIETKRNRVRVSTDGEVTLIRPPLRYRTRPGALRVIVPKPEKV